MNSTVGLSFEIVLVKKVLAGLVNSVRDPLEKHNLRPKNVKHSSQKKKRRKLETQIQVLFSTIQMDTKGVPLPSA